MQLENYIEQVSKNILVYLLIFVTTIYFFSLRSTEVLLLGNCFYNASINSTENLGI